MSPEYVEEGEKQVGGRVVKKLGEVGVGHEKKKDPDTSRPDFPTATEKQKVEPPSSGERMDAITIDKKSRATKYQRIKGIA